MTFWSTDVDITPSTFASNSNSSTVLDNRIKLSYAEVVVSLTTAVGLLVLGILQLLYRITSRHRQLLRVQRQIRFDGAYLLGKPSTSKSRRIVEEGLKTHRNRIENPPQYNRFIPAVVASSRDSRQDCSEMLFQIRRLLKKTHGRSAELMSMRCCLSCIKAVLPPEPTERFARLYEAIAFNTDRIESNELYVTSDDIKFVHAFFYNTILKELQ